MTEKIGAEPDSQWLMRWIDRGLALSLFGFATAAFVHDWQPGKLGNAYQLVGLLFAALALPVLSPWLARVEFKISRLKDATERWIADRRERLRLWWLRVRHKTVVASMTGHASASGGAGATLTVGNPLDNAQDLSDRDWLAMLTQQVKELRVQLHDLQAGRDADRAAVDKKLDALRKELQEHTLSVTREGWDYVACGATLTAIGIVLTLI